MFNNSLQVSYMIVDEADRDIDMAADPFLEAGIDIPKELPYQERKQSLRIKMSNAKNQDPDNLSVTGSLASLAKGSSHTMTAITRLQNFRRKLGSKNSVGAAMAVPNQDQTVLGGGSMPPLRALRPLEAIERGELVVGGVMETIPSSGSEIDGNSLETQQNKQDHQTDFEQRPTVPIFIQQASENEIEDPEAEAVQEQEISNATTPAIPYLNEAFEVTEKEVAKY